MCIRDRLTGSASALLGSKKEAAEPVAGAPTVQDLEISTYRDIPYQTQFLLASSEGDVTYAVAEEPKKGTVTISGSEFTYTPEEGVTGSDSFTYTATDSQGRVSQPATVQAVSYTHLDVYKRQGIRCRSWWGKTRR